MMDGKFVKELAAQIGAGSTVVEVNGESRVVLRGSDGGWSVHETPQPAKLATPLVVTTLTALVRFIAENVDGLPLVGHQLIQVESETSVRLMSSIKDDSFRRREQFIHAKFNPFALTLNRYMPAEDMLIQLQALFEPTPDLADIVTALSTRTDGKVRTAVDDGITQVVTTKLGVALSTERKLPSTPTLAPRRTFVEVEQPKSRFLLRVKSGEAVEDSTAALIEADGGAWKAEAMRSIKAWLEAELAKLPENRRVAVIA